MSPVVDISCRVKMVKFKFLMNLKANQVLSDCQPWFYIRILCRFVGGGWGVGGWDWEIDNTLRCASEACYFIKVYSFSDMQLQMEASVLELVRFSPSHWDKWPFVSHMNTLLFWTQKVVPITKVNYLMSVSQNQVPSPYLRSSNKMNLSLGNLNCTYKKRCTYITYRGRKLNLEQCKKHKSWWKNLKERREKEKRDPRHNT